MILVSFLTDLISVIVWMDFIYTLISKSSSHFTNPSRVVLITPISLVIHITFMFHSFCSLARPRFLSISAFIYFYSVVCRDRKDPYSTVSLSFFAFFSFFFDHHWVFSYGRLGWSVYLFFVLSPFSWSSLWGHWFSGGSVEFLFKPIIGYKFWSLI